jgi:hypothetical protein
MSTLPLVYNGYLIQKMCCEGEQFTENCFAVYDIFDNVIAIRHTQGLCEKFVDDIT